MKIQNQTHLLHQRQISNSLTQIIHIDYTTVTCLINMDCGSTQFWWYASSFDHRTWSSYQM